MDSIRDVKEALTARSTTTTLDELKSRGKKKVRVIRAGDIAAIVSQAVRRALEASELISQEEVEALVAQSREEFQSILRDREGQARDAKEQLQNVKQERDELKQKLENAPAAAPAQGTAMSGDLVSALDKMANTLNERLDKFGKKIGVSSAVDGEEVNLEALFNDSDLADLESNMDDIEVKQTTGRGIAANLERLKKLKGGD